MDQFSDRVAVVTGGASGIGLALARTLAARGADVVIADVEAAALDSAAAELEGVGGDVLAVQTDVTDASSVQNLADRVIERFGRVHVVCHNAGVFAAGLAWETPVEDYRWVFDVNVLGVVHGVRTFTPLQLAHGEPGHIVITSSMAGLTSGPYCAAYFMSKHAAFAMAESLHAELAAADSAIGVSVVCPEMINTGIGSSDRNRPPAYSWDGPSHAERDFINDGIRMGTAGGLDPSVIAERTVEAIRSGQLYVLAPEGNEWRDRANARLDDLRLARNPNS